MCCHRHRINTSCIHMYITHRARKEKRAYTYTHRAREEELAAVDVHLSMHACIDASTYLDSVAAHFSVRACVCGTASKASGCEEGQRSRERGETADVCVSVCMPVRVRMHACVRMHARAWHAP